MAEWYDNVDRRGYNSPNYYDGALPYNANLNNENLGKSLAGSVGNMSGIMGLRRPDNLTQDMGASMYQAPPVYQGQRNIHEGFGTADVSSTFAPPEKKGFFSKFTTPMMALLKSQQDNPEEAFGKNYYSSSLKDGRVNRNPAFNLHGDMNVSSGFGVGLGAAGNKRIANIKNTIAGFADQWGNLKKEEEQGLHTKYSDKLARHQEKLRQFMIQNKKYKTALGQGPKEEIIKEKITVDGPNVHGGEGNQGGSYQDQGGGYSTQGGFTQATQASPDTGRGHHSWADGGRIGYNRGRVVNPGGYAGDEKGILEKFISPFKQIFSGQTEAVLGGDQKKINEFLTEEGWGINLDPETISMIVDMNKKGMGIDEIVSLTGSDANTVTSIIERLNMKADGGRIGYQGGELVDEDINIQGPGFDVNENMEMAEKSPFEMRIDELMDTGMSWQEAYEIARDEFNQIAEGPEESFSEEGIASIV